MSKANTPDTTIPGMTGEEWKQLKHQRRMRNALVIAAITIPIGSGILWLFLAPSTWGWLPKIIIAILIPAFLFWLFVILEDNIRYHKRKREQARKKQSLAAKPVRSYLKRLNSKPCNDKVGQTFITFINKSNDPRKNNK